MYTLFGLVLEFTGRVVKIIDIFIYQICHFDQIVIHFSNVYLFDCFCFGMLEHFQ